MLHEVKVQLPEACVTERSKCGYHSHIRGAQLPYKSVITCFHWQRWTTYTKSLGMQCPASHINQAISTAEIITFMQQLSCYELNTARDARWLTNLTYLIVRTQCCLSLTKFAWLLPVHNMLLLAWFTLFLVQFNSKVWMIETYRLHDSLNLCESSEYTGPLY